MFSACWIKVISLDNCLHRSTRMYLVNRKLWTLKINEFYVLLKWDSLLSQHQKLKSPSKGKLGVGLYRLTLWVACALWTASQRSLFNHFRTWTDIWNNLDIIQLRHLRNFCFEIICRHNFFLFLILYLCLIFFYFILLKQIIIIIIIISCWQHGYPWPSFATPPYRSSP